MTSPSVERLRLDSPLRGACFAWRAWNALRASWGQLMRTRREARTEWCQHILSDLDEAERTHEFRRVWHLSYCLTRNGLRPRKRWRPAAGTTALDFSEWLPWLSQPGARGGQGMRPIWIGSENSFQRLRDLGQ